MLLILGERDRGNDRLDEAVRDGGSAAGNLERGTLFHRSQSEGNREAATTPALCQILGPATLRQTEPEAIFRSGSGSATLSTCARA